MTGSGRASPGDVVNLAVDRGSVPMNIAALLTFAADSRPLVADLGATIGDRADRVPRLTQRLVRTPPGCGRPVWVDDVRFRLDGHLEAAPLPAPAGPASPPGPPCSQPPPPSAGWTSWTSTWES